MHRDIKGANILVDNKGQIKLADFFASKKVVELATMTGAKSMKGTPYWMAPEVICQTGHSFSADIWSVGCTVIEMATGKPPWSQQYQEVAALFYIGTTKAHPPIPDHLSAEAKDFLLKCLQNILLLLGITRRRILSFAHQSWAPLEIRYQHLGIRPMWGSNRYDDDMCQLDDDDLMAGTSMRLDPNLSMNDVNKSFNPMMEPDDDWPCQFDGSPEVGTNAPNLFTGQVSEINSEIPTALGNEDNGFTFPNGSGVEEEEEVTEIKIRAFLVEKVKFDTKLGLFYK